MIEAVGSLPDPRCAIFGQRSLADDSVSCRSTRVTKSKRARARERRPCQRMRFLPLSTMLLNKPLYTTATPNLPQSTTIRDTGSSNSPYQSDL